jgi:hypothetical protein
MCCKQCCAPRNAVHHAWRGLRRGQVACQVACQVDAACANLIHCASAESSFGAIGTLTNPDGHSAAHTRTEGCAPNRYRAVSASRDHRSRGIETRRHATTAQRTNKQTNKQTNERTNGVGSRGISARHTTAAAGALLAAPTRRNAARRSHRAVCARHGPRTHRLGWSRRRILRQQSSPKGPMPNRRGTPAHHARSGPAPMGPSTLSRRMPPARHTVTLWATLSVVSAWASLHTVNGVRCAPLYRLTA